MKVKDCTAVAYYFFKEENFKNLRRINDLRKR